MATKYKSQVTNKWIGSRYRGLNRHVDARTTEMGQIVSALRNDLTPAMNNWGDKYIENKKTAAGAKMDELYAKGWTTKDIQKAILNNEIPELSNHYATSVVDAHSGRFEAAETIKKINENIDDGYDYKDGTKTIEEFWKQYLPNFSEASKEFTVGFSAVFNEWAADAKIQDAKNRAKHAHEVKINKAITFMNTTVPLEDIDDKYWKQLMTLNTEMPIDGTGKAYFFDTTELNEEVAIGHANFLLAKATTTDELDYALKILTSDRGTGKGKNKLRSLLESNPTEVGEILGKISQKRARIESKSRTDKEYEDKENLKNLFVEFWKGYDENSKNLEEWREKIRAIDPTAVPTFNRLLNDKRATNASNDTIDEFLLSVRNGEYDNINDLNKDIVDLEIPREFFGQIYSYYSQSMTDEKQDIKPIYQTNTTYTQAITHIQQTIKENLTKDDMNPFSAGGANVIRKGTNYIYTQILYFEEYDANGNKRANKPTELERQEFMSKLGDYMDKTYTAEEKFEDLERWSIVEKEILKEEQDKIKKEKEEKELITSLPETITTNIGSMDISTLPPLEENIWWTPTNEQKESVKARNKAILDSLPQIFKGVEINQDLVKILTDPKNVESFTPFMNQILGAFGLEVNNENLGQLMELIKELSVKAK